MDLQGGAFDDRLEFKVWRADRNEPASPQVTVTNSTHTSGQVGLVAIQSGGSAFRPCGATFDDIQFFPEPSRLADVSLDGIVNGLDVDPFVDVLLDGPYQAEADMNEDGDVNGLDVDLFVDAVVGGGVQSAIPEPTTLLLAITATLVDWLSRARFR